jgi:hypothetical protein
VYLVYGQVRKRSRPRACNVYYISCFYSVLVQPVDGRLRRPELVAIYLYEINKLCVDGDLTYLYCDRLINTLKMGVNRSPWRSR